MNAYELSSKRFEEYSDEELIKLSELVKTLNIGKKENLDNYLNKKDKEIIPILIALRELAKYNILFVVKTIRYELLELAKDKKIDNIFNKKLKDVI